VAGLQSRCGPGGACGDPGLVIEGEKARARAELSGWALGGGLTLTLGGLAWYLLDRESLNPRDTAANRIRWTAAVGSDGASLQVVGPL
jgi:hypothetical protein